MTGGRSVLSIVKYTVRKYRIDRLYLSFLYILTKSIDSSLLVKKPRDVKIVLNVM